MSNPPEQEDSTPVTNPPRDGNESRRPDAAGADSSARWSRRRFGKAALVATPVLATMYGRPLHAAANCTPSGWISGNTSLHHEPVDCGGGTPGFWQGPGSESYWGEHRQKRLNSDFGFQERLPAFVVDDEEMRDATMQDAVSRSVAFVGVSQDSLVRKLVFFGAAALLNAKFITGYSLTQQQVRKMVDFAVDGDNFVTSSGDELTPAQVKAFLENTMDEPNFFDPSLID